MSSPLEGGNPSGFRPQRRGFQENSVTENTDQPLSSTPKFTKKTQDQPNQRSVFPEWDLLPPKSIIRRKGTL